MTWRLLLVSLVVFLAGCGTIETREQALNRMLSSWVGKHIDELVPKVGPPTRTFELSNGGSVYTWQKNESGFVVMPFMGSVVATPSEVYCTINMTSERGGRIVSYSFEGNAC
jgi:hypothetical protein